MPRPFIEYVSTSLNFIISFQLKKSCGTNNFVSGHRCQLENQQFYLRLKSRSHPALQLPCAEPQITH
jgi:hypothetical protein